MTGPGGIDELALRRLAEDLLRSRGAAPLPAPSGGDVQRLVHDLQVHQVELEMQNEELRRAQADLGAASARYFELYDRAPVGYCTLDAQGLIQEANLTAADLLGLARKTLVGLPLERFIAKSEQDNYYLQRRRPHPLNGKQTYELLMCKADGSRFWAQLVENGGQDVNADGSRRVVLNDISVRKREESIRERLLAAVEQVGDSIVITDLAGAIQYVNPAFERSTGHARSECLGRNPSILKSGSHPAAFYQGLWATLTAGRTWKGRLENRRKDGSPLVEDAVITPVLDGDRNITHYVAVKREAPVTGAGPLPATNAEPDDATILLVQDAPHDLDQTRRMLTDQGFQVLTATNPGEALALAAAHGGRLCLMVSDRTVQGLRGRELARRVTDLAPGLRVLLLSEYSAELSSDGEGFPLLRKPFTAQALAKKLAETLEAGTP